MSMGAHMGKLVGKANSNAFELVTSQTEWFYLSWVPAAVAELEDRAPRMRELKSLVLGRVKPMTYKIDTCHFLACRSALLG